MIFPFDTCIFCTFFLNEDFFGVQIMNLKSVFLRSALVSELFDFEVFNDFLRGKLVSCVRGIRSATTCLRGLRIRGI